MAYIGNLTNQFGDMGLGGDRPPSQSPYQSPPPPRDGYGQGVPSPAPGQYYGGPPPLPTYQPPSDKPPLPQGWTPLFDQSLQRWYYANKETGVTQWEAPGYIAPRPPMETRPSSDSRGAGGQSPYPPAAPYGATPGGYGAPPGAGGYGAPPGPPPGAGGYGVPPGPPLARYDDTRYDDSRGEKKKSGKGGLLLGAAGGVAAGLAGGALLHHVLSDSDSDEERRHERYEEERYEDEERREDYAAAAPPSQTIIVNEYNTTNEYNTNEYVSNDYSNTEYSTTEYTSNEYVDNGDDVRVSYQETDVEVQESDGGYYEEETETTSYEYDDY